MAPPDEDTSQYAALVREVVEAITEARASRAATRETLDKLGATLDSMVVVVQASQDVIGRLATAQEAEATAAEEARAGRYALLNRVASSGPAQLLFGGVVVASLQALGVGYLVAEILPSAIVTHATVAAPADPVAPVAPVAAVAPVAPVAPVAATPGK